MSDRENPNERNNKVEIIKVLLRERRYQDIDERWRFLSGDEVLELMLYSFESGNEKLIDKEHFEKWSPDTIFLKDKIAEFAELFKLSKGQVDFVRRGFCGERYKDKETVREVALYTRFLGYSELVKKFDFISPETFGGSPRIFKCDPRRTESRIRFLLEIGRINFSVKEGVLSISNYPEFMEDLYSKTENFNYRYQSLLEKKIQSLDKEGDYKAIASMVYEVPDYSYDKFLELALRAIYGDKSLLTRIEERKERFEKNKISQNILQISNEQKSVETASQEVASLESKIDMVSNDEVLELFNVIEMNEPTNPRGGGNTHLRERGESNRLPLDEKAIDEYINKLKAMGIKCLGYITSNAGIKVANEDYVRHYVFEYENYKILEPIGQPGNASYVIPFTDDKEFEEMMKENTKRELVMQERAVQVNHKLLANGEYNYSPMRVKNLIQIVKEGKKDLSNGWTIEKLQSEITELVPESEIPEAVEYITEFTKATAKRISNKIKKMEKRISEEEAKKESTKADEEVDV